MGEPQLKNLSVLPVSTEEEAMRLLFLGDTNRVIAETPLNEYSSRSHCIFTIYVKMKTNPKSVTYSKLHLVDLAGSERVYKSNIGGTGLHEAKQINLSLHFLQQVVLALSEPKRTHIPYRNSVLTFILKDSLGGNCLTVMLANLSLSCRNILETISTCKFAQRVSLIQVDASVNEISDPHEEILLLRTEICELKKKLAEKEKTSLEALTAKQKENIHTLLEKFLKNKNSVCKSLLVDPRNFEYCLEALKNKIVTLEQKLNSQNDDCCKSVCDSQTKNYQSQTNFSRDEIDYYVKSLTRTYDRAKILASTIEECQLNIKFLKEKLNLAVRNGNLHKKRALSQELEIQQAVYKKSLNELRETKNETMQLEAGLQKAKEKAQVNEAFRINCEQIAVVFDEDEEEESRKSCNQVSDLTHYECGCYPPITFLQGRCANDFRNKLPDVNSFARTSGCNECDLQDITNCCTSNLETCLSLPNIYSPKCAEAPNCQYEDKYLAIEENIHIDSDIQLVPSKLVHLSTSANATQKEKLEDGVSLEHSLKKEAKRYELFLESDTDEFKSFISTIELTGDEEVDKEICDFYRSKMCKKVK